VELPRSKAATRSPRIAGPAVRSVKMAAKRGGGSFRGGGRRWMVAVETRGAPEYDKMATVKDEGGGSGAAPEPAGGGGAQLPHSRATIAVLLRCGVSESQNFYLSRARVRPIISQKHLMRARLLSGFVSTAGPLKFTAHNVPHLPLFIFLRASFPFVSLEQL
jgi:hypothetical protein